MTKHHLFIKQEIRVEEFITLGINSSLLINLFSVNINYEIIKLS